MELKGITAANGIVIGPVMIYETQKYEPAESLITEEHIEQSIEEYHQVRERAAQELNTLENHIKSEDEEKAKIFFAQQQLLNDPEIIERIETSIREELKCTDYAVSSIYNESIIMLKGLEDPLIAERSVDLCDVKNRLLRILYGQKEKNLSCLPKSVIIVAHDLLPSEIATLDRNHCLGLITEQGNTTSHTAIMARSYNIPTIVGAASALMLLHDEEQILLDAYAGKVYRKPSNDIVKECKEKERMLLSQQTRQKQLKDLPCRMADGEKIELGINIGSRDFLHDTGYYDCVGLLRTEFLFMDRSYLPTEEEQFNVYRDIMEQCKGKTVTLRTLDIGGDKMLPSQMDAKEENPALGKRAIRYCLQNPDFFVTQLKAALRASAYGPLQLLFPMVSSMEDINQIKAMLADVKNSLREEKIGFDEQVKIGVMIEIPAVALIADLVAKEVDFASIGTNDLTQYLCAADRLNPAMSSYYQMMSPAMIRVLGYIFDTFKKQNKPVSVCGELARDPEAAILLVGLGARALSMDPMHLSVIKERLGSLSIKEAECIADSCKTMTTEEDIRKFIQK